MTTPDELHFSLPPWVHELATERSYPDDHSRMGLAITLARENVRRGTGGPFGAAIFETGSGRLVAMGVNSVVRLKNSTLHAEMLAFMLAQHHVGHWSLSDEQGTGHELVTSCEPCAMCLGAVLWSGVRRVVCGAQREDASRLAFDEGPVFEASYKYLEARGIEMVFGVRRAEAVEVLEEYAKGGGMIYNG